MRSIVLLLAITSLTSAVATPAGAAEPERKQPVKLIQERNFASFQFLQLCDDGTILTRGAPTVPQYSWFDTKTGKRIRDFGPVPSDRTNPPLMVAASAKAFQLLERREKPTEQVVDHAWDGSFRRGEKADADEFTHLTPSGRPGEVRLTCFDAEAVVTCVMAKGKRSEEVLHAVVRPPNSRPSFPADSDWCVISAHDPKAQRQYETVLLNLADAKGKPVPLILDAPVSATAFAASHLLLGTESGTLYRYDIKTQAVQAVPVPTRQRIMSITYDPAKKLAYAGSFDTKPERPNLLCIDVVKAVPTSGFVLAESFVHAVFLLDDKKTLGVISESSSYLNMNWIPLSDFKAVEK